MAIWASLKVTLSCFFFYLKSQAIHNTVIHTQGRPSFIKLHFLSFILVHGSHLESHITYYGQPNIALMLLRCFHVSLTILGLTLFNSLPLSTYSHFLIDEYGRSYNFQLGILDLLILLNQTINSFLNNPDKHHHQLSL